MLVLANGAFKSGSTWLRNVVQQFLLHEPIPRPYRDPKYDHWIDPKKIKALLDTNLCSEHVYLSKAHIYDENTRDIILSSTDTKILNIKRDLRDVLVSSYYHTKRLNKYTGDFRTYYWYFGRLKAYQICQYHRVWNIPSDQVLLTRFENLKQDFDVEIQKISMFLGVTLSRNQVQHIKNETSMERMRQRRGESTLPEEKRFYRRGQIGEWTNYFDQNMIEDLTHIETHGLSLFDRTTYRVLFDSRSAIKRLFWGKTHFLAQLLERI